MFRETFNSFLSEEYPRHKFVAATEAGADDATLHDGLSDLGLFTLLVPEHYGGLGLGFVDLALILEEMGKALVPISFVDTIIGSDLIVRFGTEEHKAQLLSDLAEGKVSMVTAMQEKDSGFGIDSLDCEIVTTALGRRLNGIKILVPGASTTNYLLVIVRDRESEQTVTVLLERDRAGISVSDNSTLDSSCRFCEIHFEDVVISDSDLLVDKVAGESARRLFDITAMAAALHMTGIASKVLELSVEYASQRVQFDKPIGSFQAIKHKCADMAVAIDASRSAAYYAAWAVAENTADCARAVSVAKSYCGDAAGLACKHGIQIHGGMGFTWELGLHYYLRRTKVLQYSYGDASYHRERVITDTLVQMANAD